LALIKRLVEMHHGSVVAESAGAGHGSTFTVRLPRAGAPEQVQHILPSLAETHTTSSKRILVVDDHVDGATALAMMFNFYGHETQIAYSGPDALEAAVQFKPEVVFLDIGLPGMDGYEVAKRFRTDCGVRDAFLVAMTGWGTERDRERSRAAGFDEHLTKPIEPSTFEELLTRFDNLRHSST